MGDFKRIIAFSTSSQLGLIGLFFARRHFLASMTYVYVHAFFKAGLFIFCRLSIHGIDSQLSKFFSNSILRSRSNFLLLVMVRTPFLSVAFLKDPFLHYFLESQRYFTLLSCLNFLECLAYTLFLGD